MIARFLLCMILWMVCCAAAPTAGFGQDSNSRVVQGQALPKQADSAGQAAGHFVKVFDVQDSGFREWLFPAFGLLFVAIGLLILAFPKLIRAIGIPYLNFQSGLQKFVPYLFIGFAVLWTTVAFFTTYSTYLRHRALVVEGRCNSVEGPVEHFVPMPYGGHAQESFSVAGVPFRYSDFIITGGFNNTSSHGGPINGDSYVRICYDRTDGAILRLEITDLKGNLPDYTTTKSAFPALEDFQHVVRPRSAIKAPWYGNLFLVLLILDFIAIWVLYLPYLRSYFRFKAVAVQDCPIPEILESGNSVKLRNSLVFWDRESRTIWLRPRGFNLFQIPFSVATLNADESGRTIREYQIRFSSGFPVVMLAFLWTAYAAFSASAPSSAAGVPPPGIFIGVVAAMFLIVGFFNVRMLRSRMVRLVEDALSELREMPNP